MHRRILKLAASLLALSILLQAADTFKDVEYLYKAEGKDKGQQIGGNLAFDSAAQTMAFQSKKMTLELHAQSITSALYERTSKPRYAAGLLLAWPLLFTKTKSHFLTIQYKSETGEGNLRCSIWTRATIAKSWRQLKPRSGRR